MCIILILLLLSYTFFFKHKACKTFDKVITLGCSMVYSDSSSEDNIFLEEIKIDCKRRVHQYEHCVDKYWIGLEF
jgi:hypothetical protein